MRLPDSVREHMLRLLAQDAAARADGQKREPAGQAGLGLLPASLRAWLSAATGQMRWKRARPYAEAELRAHLEDQYEALLLEGMDEQAAAAQTVREMGDPVETGTRLDRAWRPTPDWLTLAMVLALAAAGVVLQYLLRAPLQEPMGLGELAVHYLLGAAALLAGYFLDYTIWGRHTGALLALWCAVGLLLLTGPLRRFYGGVNYYLRYWVWFFPVLFGGVLYRQHGRGRKGIGVCLASLLALWFFCMAAPATGACLAITAACTALMVAAAWRGWLGSGRKRALAAALTPLWLLAGSCTVMYGRYAHVREKLHALLHPLENAWTSGFQTVAAWEALFGNICAPEARDSVIGWFSNTGDGATDFFLIAVKLRWGWLAFALVVAALLALLVRGLLAAHRQGGALGKIMCYTVVLTLAVQTALYLLQNFGLSLFSAYGLPLLSYGKIYLCQTMFLLGILLSAQQTGGLACAPALSHAMARRE